MSGRESWKTWVIIIVILIATGLVAAIWPLISASLPGASLSAPSLSGEIEVVTLNIPPVPFLPFLAEGATLTFTSFQAMLALSMLVIGPVVVVGIVLAIINLLLSRWKTRVETSESYQENQSALDKMEREKLKQLQAGREAPGEQQSDYSRWAVIATALAILMFAAFFGYLVADTLFPERVLIGEEQVINITLIIVVAFMLLALLVLVLRLNRQRLQAVEETDYKGIPWDVIAIVITGVVVVGLGIGLVVFFNSPT